ncbi:MAG TPA: hypothetical protein DCO65_04960, partial [Spartobacteria bacterium]|nr:hypothetical protein [Spartobacteria bacterium]
MATHWYARTVRAPEIPQGLDWLNVRRHRASRISGAGWRSSISGRGIPRAGGVGAGARGLYIADTNNHRIAVAAWETGTVAVSYTHL